MFTSRDVVRVCHVRTMDNCARNTKMVPVKSHFHRIYFCSLNYISCLWKHQFLVSDAISQLYQQGKNRYALVVFAQKSKVCAELMQFVCELFTVANLQWLVVLLCGFSLQHSSALSSSTRNAWHFWDTPPNRPSKLVLFEAQSNFQFRTNTSKSIFCSCTWSLRRFSFAPQRLMNGRTFSINFQRLHSHNNIRLVCHSVNTMKCKNFWLFIDLMTFTVVFYTHSSSVYYRKKNWIFCFSMITQQCNIFAMNIALNRKIQTLI